MQFEQSSNFSIWREKLQQKSNLDAVLGGFILGESPLFSIVGFGIQSWPYVYKMKHSEPSKTAITLEVMDNEWIHNMMTWQIAEEKCKIEEWAFLPIQHRNLQYCCNVTTFHIAVQCCRDIAKSFFCNITLCINILKIL